MTIRGVACSSPLLLSVALVMSCSSSRYSGRLMYDFLPHDPQKVEHILDKTEGDETEDVLIALAAVKGPSNRKLNALQEVTIDSFESGGPAARGVEALHPALSAAAETAGAAAATSAPPQCVNKFCAGVASRSLDPFLWDPLPPANPLLDRRPSSSFLRWLSGTSHPPLAGYFRLRPNPFAIVLRFAYPRQYYAHAFKDSRGTAPCGPTIQAKALVLRDSQGHRFYWVKTDLIGAFQDLRQAVIDGLHDQGLDDADTENLLFHGTHTHSGMGALNPRLFPQILTVDRFVPTLFDVVTNQIVEALVEANQNLQPARIGVGSTTNSELTRNRRGTCEEKGDPANTLPDPAIGVLRINQANDIQALATIFNFAIHGTSLSDSNLMLSPDNMGWAEWFIEEETGGMALFFNGAQGDVAPHGAPDTSNLTNEQYVGQELANSVLAALPAIGTSDEVELGSRHCHLDLPVGTGGCPVEYQLEQFQFRPLMFLDWPLGSGCYLDRGEGKVYPISKEKDPPYIEREGAMLAAFRIQIGTGSQASNTLVMTLPGEPITDIGEWIKNNAPDAADNAWVFGLSNAHMGYIVTEEEYEQGGYESGANFFGPTEGERLSGIALYLGAKLFE